MKILLDEDVPLQVADFLRPLLEPSGVVAVDHVDDVRWKGKKDRFLIPDCAKAGYSVFVTKDRNQLNDPDETAIIRKSGIHHVTFRMDNGRSGLARAVASIIAAMPAIVEDLKSGRTAARLDQEDQRKPKTTRHYGPKCRSAAAYWRGRTAPLRRKESVNATLHSPRDYNATTTLGQTPRRMVNGENIRARHGDIGNHRPPMKGTGYVS